MSATGDRDKLLWLMGRLKELASLLERDGLVGITVTLQQGSLWPSP
jgi:hypothetical protein